MCFIYLKLYEETDDNNNKMKKKQQQLGDPKEKERRKSKEGKIGVFIMYIDVYNHTFTQFGAAPGLLVNFLVTC